jgi:hypothetical protein
MPSKYAIERHTNGAATRNASTNRAAGPRAWHLIKTMQTSTKARSWLAMATTVAAALGGAKVDMREE